MYVSEQKLQQCPHTVSHNACISLQAAVYLILNCVFIALAQSTEHVVSIVKIQI